MIFNSIVFPKVFFSIFIIILIALNVALLLRIKNQNIAYNSETIASERRLETSETINENFRNMILNNISSESSPINPDLILTNVFTKTKTSIGKIAKNSPISILRFSEYSCHACIEQSFIIINNLAHPFREEKFIIIASYESLRDLLLFKSNNNINYLIYTIRNDTLKIPLESLNFPYFFILNTDNKATNFFYPLTSSPELTEDYFLIIRYKFPLLFK